MAYLAIGPSRCREPVVWKTSWTDSNPRRRFVGCPNYGTPKFCQFMEWRDPEVHPRYRDVILGLMRKAENIREDKPKEKIFCGRHTCGGGGGRIGASVSSWGHISIILIG
ncbi:unnamed protein product [Cuscuta campestris]|uniref:Zinc finger GRF-type domain-containing protein n=1 Tax=Cuscuta campestris TaxID=132261 RepID=A0A484K5Q3_9ASTE|nr:unnamed protein product [Cuscuta campestris]